MHHGGAAIHDREHRPGGASGEEEASFRGRLEYSPSQDRGTAIKSIAVDWSGAARGAHRKIWLAEAREGQLLRLESGRTREELVERLEYMAEDTRDLVVGLDFAFSLPAWFLEERGLRSARDLWRLVAREGEEWLDRCDPPFWGRPGMTKPDDLPAHFRKTEQEIREATGAWPKSPFQIGGAGAVGTASLRGMPHLLELSEAGFSIWPFDEHSLPLVVEIYPRLLTGEVKKSDPDARLTYLRREYPGLREDHLEEAAASDDAFDAAVSALVMDTRSRELSTLERATDPVPRLEGAIWRPERSDRSGGQDLDEALVYARRLHEGQQRKGPGETPYFAHLLGTCSLVLEAGGDEEQAVAALLHDAAEDQGGREMLEEIRVRFGDRVARIVHGCSDTMETPKPPWQERKEAYLDNLPNEPPYTLLVSCADKVYNARSMLRDYRLHGDALWDRFRSSAEDNLWYYRGLVDAFGASELESWLVDELEWTVEELADRISSGE